VDAAQAVDVAAQFAEHARLVARACERALERSAERRQPFEGVLFHAGSTRAYHADDQEISFRPVPHFARWAPVPGPGHWLVWRPGRRPQLIRQVPDDYWYGEPEPPPLPEGALEAVYDLERATDSAQAAAQLGPLRGFAYVGSDPELARSLGIADRSIEPAALLASLDWDRGYKTRYEVGCIREAAHIASRGHAAAHVAALAGESERAIHAAFLSASGLLESESPYPNIIARNEAAAVLHYEAKRARQPGPERSFLIDAGAPCRGYASDITRSYALRDAHPVFCDLLAGMEQLQEELAAAVAPGSYVELHLRAARGVCALLRAAGLLHVEPDEALDREIDRAFLPHGLGHHLGLQVHDVGGHQITPEGERCPPPARAPHLRTTRPLEAGHVVTIEPGLYFIGLLLDELRASEHAECLDWDLVDALRPCGGIRVEDDVHVTQTGSENLSRPWLPGATRA
jgi:Xaa-Pro dipeptidase